MNRYCLFRDSAVSAILLLASFSYSSLYAATPTASTQATSHSVSTPVDQASADQVTSGDSQASVVQTIADDRQRLRKNLTIDNSVIEKRQQSQKQVAKLPFAITLMPQTYVLPYYYTQKPYGSVYKGTTPDDQPILPSEFKAKLGLQLPLWSNMLNSRFSLYVSYQQLSYWQFYSQSQFFRETNYQPAIYLQSYFLKNATWQLGAVHESNGRGGDLERSWNRAYFDLRFSGQHWLFSVKPWILIFKSESSDLHNPDIAHYLGYGRLLAACHFYHQTFTFMMRNVAESGFKRGALEGSWSFPLPFAPNNLRGFVQVFSGYGQSLIEYDHYTNSAGVGIVLSDWI